MVGEEFCVMTPGVDAETAHIAIARVRTKLSATAIPIDGGSVTLDPVVVTASIGIWTGIPLRGDTLDDLLRRADAAMYQAKADGRDCVRPWKEDLG